MYTKPWLILGLPRVHNGVNGPSNLAAKPMAGPPRFVLFLGHTSSLSSFGSDERLRWHPALHTTPDILKTKSYWKREAFSVVAMAEHHEHDESKVESMMDKISEKIHDHDSSSSSDSDDEAKKRSSPSSSMKSKIYRMFGREKPVHKVLGGGKPADVFLWRNNKISAGVLGVASGVWVLFELLEYHLLTLVCHFLILALAILFLWCNASIFINKSPPRIPEVQIPEEPVLQFVSALRIEINWAFALLRDIASGRDLKKFLYVIAGLWVLSIVGSWCSFLTLFYIVFVLLHTVPVFYEKYEDQVDSFADKATAEIKKHYAVFDAKVLSKIPRGPLKDRKKD